MKKTYAPDSIGAMVPTKLSRDVFCDLSSTSASEWYDAGNAGMKAEYRVTMFAPDYDGEDTAEVDGTPYAIYRTYRRRDDMIELYLATKAGVSG